MILERRYRRRGMTLPKIVSQEEWETARRDLLLKEKQATKDRDRLNTERRELPMVEVTKDYAFEGPDGTVSLLDLFEGRPQLIVYHFMFHPGLGGRLPELHGGHRRALARVPRPPAHAGHDLRAGVAGAAREARALEGQARLGPIPWYSTNDGDFSYDFGATIDASRGFDEFNFRTLDEYAAMGEESMRDSEQPYDMPGRTCFLQVDGRMFRTYSVVRPGPREHRRLVLLPRPHRARSPGGLGGAQGPLRVRPRQQPRLRVLAVEAGLLLALALGPAEDALGHRAALLGGALAEDLGAHLVHAGVVGRGLGGQLGEVAGQAEVAGRGQLGGPLGEPRRRRRRGDATSAAMAASVGGLRRAGLPSYQPP